MPGMTGSNMAVAPLTASSSLAVARALGEGCCAAAGAAQPSQARARANAPWRASVVKLMNSSSGLRSRPLDDANAVRPRDDSHLGEPNEETMLDHTGNLCE